MGRIVEHPWRLPALPRSLLCCQGTSLYVELYGERAPPNVLVLVNEVVDGGWGFGGGILTAAMVNGD